MMGTIQHPEYVNSQFYTSVIKSWIRSTSHSESSTQLNTSTKRLFCSSVTQPLSQSPDFGLAKAVT